MSMRDTGDEGLKEFTHTGKPRCQYANVPGQGGWHNHQCYVAGNYKSKDGKVYCKTHLPENVKAKLDANQEKWDNEWDLRNRQSERLNAMTKFCKDFTNEQLEKMPPVRDLIDFWNLNGGNIK